MAELTQQYDEMKWVVDLDSLESQSRQLLPMLRGLCDGCDLLCSQCGNSLTR